MILPIYAFGNPVLKRKGKPIDTEYKELAQLIENMWETMYNAQGIGLAAPQVGLDIRLFLVDSKQLEEEGEDFEGIKKVFINAEMIEEYDEIEPYEEGCLSIPQIRADVIRNSSIKISYYDENFEKNVESFTGINARVIQHEYDHIEGILFTEKLKPIRKRRIQRKLENIKKGDIKVNYRMKFV